MIWSIYQFIFLNNCVKIFIFLLHLHVSFKFFLNIFNTLKFRIIPSDNFKTPIKIGTRTQENKCFIFKINVTDLFSCVNEFLSIMDIYIAFLIKEIIFYGLIIYNNIYHYTLIRGTKQFHTCNFSYFAAHNLTLWFFLSYNFIMLSKIF